MVLKNFFTGQQWRWIWELDCEEGWAPKNWCFWTVVLEKTLGSPLDCKEIQPVHSKGNQSWIFIERTDAEAETPILWPPDAKNWLIWKDPDAGKDWGQEKGMTEDEIVGWHHRLDGLEFEYWLTDCVSIYLLVDIWVVSTFWLLYIMVLWTGLPK